MGSRTDRRRSSAEGGLIYVEKLGTFPSHDNSLRRITHSPVHTPKAGPRLTIMDFGNASEESGLKQRHHTTPPTLPSHNNNNNNNDDDDISQKHIAKLQHQHYTNDPEVQALRVRNYTKMMNGGGHRGTTRASWQPKQSPTRSHEQFNSHAVRTVSTQRTDNGIESDNTFNIISTGTTIINTNNNYNNYNNNNNNNNNNDDPISRMMLDAQAEIASSASVTPNISPHQTPKASLRRIIDTPPNSPPPTTTTETKEPPPVAPTAGSMFQGIADAETMDINVFNTPRRVLGRNLMQSPAFNVVIAFSTIYAIVGMELAEATLGTRKVSQ